MIRLIDEYKDLIIQRDNFISEAEQAQLLYVKEFGEINILIFEESIECIKLKKSIEYCLKCVNNNHPVDMDKVNEICKLVSDMNLSKLSKMREERKYALKGKFISGIELKEIKTHYRKLAKMFHPDVNPICQEEVELIEFWSRIYDAYIRNDYKCLMECEVMAKELIEKYNLGEIDVDIDNLEEKIGELEIEIQNIITNEPYTYTVLLGDEQAVKNRHEELDAMLENYRDYHKELQAAYDKIFEERGGTFVWTMN